MPPTNLKACTCCGVVKATSEFYRASVLRLHSRCIQCMKRHWRDPPEKSTRMPRPERPVRRLSPQSLRQQRLRTRVLENTD